MIYSFFGFLLEVGFARATHNRKKDRKCFYFLPLCPVYGFGALLILAGAAVADGRVWLVAALSAAGATAAEYGMGLFYEKALGVSFWDYSHLPLNVGGKVCLLFSLAWCGLGLALVYWVHPAVAAWVEHIPRWLTLPTALFLCLDTGFTIHVLRRDRSTDALLWYRQLPRRARPKVD